MSEAQTLSYDDLKNEFRLTNDGDSWGTCMMWWFAVAGEMYVRDLPIPAEWQYRPGLSPVEADCYESELCAMATDEALQQFGVALNRLAAILKKLGKDY